MLSRSIFCRSAAVTNRVVLRSSEPGGPNGVSTTTGLPVSHWPSAHADKKRKRQAASSLILLDMCRSNDSSGTQEE